MRDATPDMKALYEQREALNRRVGEVKARGGSVAELIEESRALSATISALTAPTPTAGQQIAEAAAAFSVSVLTSVSEVDALRDEWRTLLLSVPTIASPFMTWEWMMSWYETYEGHGSIRCITVRASDGRLVGIVPLFLSLRPDRTLGKREIGFASNYSCSSGFDLVMLCASDDCGKVSDAMVQCLASMRDEWRCVKLLRMPADSRGVWEVVRSLACSGCLTLTRASLATPVVPLPKAPGNVVGSFSSRKLKRNIRQAQRRLDNEQPQHRFTCITAPDEIMGHLDECVRLNIRGRAAAGLPPSRLLNADERAFLERSTRRLAEAGWLKLVTLSIGPRPVGFGLFIIYRGHVHLLSTAWAREYARYSPSHLLLVEAMCQGVREGAVGASFLDAGGHYKAHYTRMIRPRLDVIAAPRRHSVTQLLLRETGAAALRSLSSKLRRSRARAPSMSDK